MRHIPNKDCRRPVRVRPYCRALDHPAADPNRVKYVVITHAHVDHFGGAQYLPDKLHATLVMSAADWNVLDKAAEVHPKCEPRSNTQARVGCKGRREAYLGDTTIEFVETPPHMSAVSTYEWRTILV